ncbi:rhodanese-like domain-containing protein [Zoogloea sp.]|uniref:rhodanese-like domain-containing protein n=1 Tax=Zoogloea sp. TaxID=49181 RepID=UPI0026092C9E|nr:rhodanese-like domain-containing protein [Zoogloea sp.]MDD3352649.1 rhodanese-like domain-containing protein [Zoogloea sp.]
MKTPLILALALIAGSPVALAQQAEPAKPYVAPPWTYKTKQLNRAEIDALLAKPGQVLVLDVRRPDELITKGSFPVFLSVQTADVDKLAEYIPKERTLITVSNRAHRAGAVGDKLTARGFKVAGAAGSLDYEDQGGKVARITPPAPRAAAN